MESVMNPNRKFEIRGAPGVLAGRVGVPGSEEKRAVAAVRGALALLVVLPAAVWAADTASDDAAVAALTHEASRVESGLGYVSRDSAKFGEYNGLGKSGAFGNGSVQLHGGGAYDSQDAKRWSLRGDNLGLQTRELSFDYGEQGNYRLNFGYSEFLHRISDSYQTPYQGAGTTGLALPASWLKPILPQVSATAINFRSLSPAASGNCLVGTGTCPASGTPSAAQLTQLQNIRNADLPLFHNFDLKTKRTRYDAGLTLQLSPQWEYVASYRHEEKQGTKAIGAISTRSTFESTVILPDVVDTNTDQFNLGLQYTGERSFLQGAYFGSMFNNHVQSMRWQDPSNLAVTSAQSSAPNNQFHQLNLTGGYNLSSATKLVAHGAYGRNTQNDGFLTDPTLPLGIPVNSLNGLVATKLFDLKLTTRPTRGLNLVAGYKFDDRDNRSPVNTYVFQDINNVPTAGSSPFNSALGLAPGTLRDNINILANRPYSKKVNQFHVDADYAIAKGQTAAAGFEWQKTDRHCNGTWIDCNDVNTARENTLRAEWRSRWTDELSSRLGYAHARRNVDYNVNGWLALAPMANVVPGAPTVGATTSVYGFLQQTGLSGWGPIAGFPATPLTGNAAIFTPNNNIVAQALYASRNQLAENPAMRRFTLANSDRNKLRTSMTWDADERLSLQGGLDYNDDDYPDSTLGLQNSKGWTLNLDGTYQVSTGLSVNAFYTFESQRSRQAGWNYVANAAAGVAAPIVGGCFPDTAQMRLNNKIDPCNAWSADAHDTAHTLGLSARKRNLLGGKLDLSGDLIFSFADTDMAVHGGNYAANLAATGSIYIPATDLPTVKSNSVSVRLNGLYTLDRQSAVRVVLAHKRLRSTDFAYDGMQTGTLTSFMPSNEQAPNYSVTVVSLSYAHSF
jgi:hypothetical protein